MLSAGISNDSFADQHPRSILSAIIPVLLADHYVLDHIYYKSFTREFEGLIPIFGLILNATAVLLVFTLLSWSKVRRTSTVLAGSAVMLLASFALTVFLERTTESKILFEAPLLSGGLYLFMIVAISRMSRPHNK